MLESKQRRRRVLERECVCVCVWGGIESFHHKVLVTIVDLVRDGPDELMTWTITFSILYFALKLVQTKVWRFGLAVCMAVIA